MPEKFGISCIKLEELEVKDFKNVDVSYLENVVNGFDESFAPRKVECEMFLNYIRYE